MDHAADQNAEFAKLYEESLKEALEGLDRLAADAKEMQEKAVEEIIKTKAERKEIEASAGLIAYETLAIRQKQMEAEIRRTLEVEYITRLLRAGRTRDEIRKWLDLSESSIQNVWTSLVGFHTSDIEGIISITQTGRGGTIEYTVRDKTLSFHWEFGGGEVLALIFIPNALHWEAQTGISLSKRTGLLTWIAQQVIRQRASGSSFRILDDVIEILPG
jgi:hypothetical protein